MLWRWSLDPQFGGVFVSSLKQELSFVIKWFQHLTNEFPGIGIDPLSINCVQVYYTLWKQLSIINCTHYSFNLSCFKPCPHSFVYWWAISFSNAQLWCHAYVCLFRSCPCHRSRLRKVLYHHPMPHSPVRRSPAYVQICPAMRSHSLLCRQPAQEHWFLLQLQLRFPSTGIQAGSQTRKAALKERHICLVNAFYPTTLPSGTWKKFMSLSDRCQVRKRNISLSHTLSHHFMRYTLFSYWFMQIYTHLITWQQFKISRRVDVIKMSC